MSADKDSVALTRFGHAYSILTCTLRLALAKYLPCYSQGAAIFAVTSSISPRTMVKHGHLVLVSFFRGLLRLDVANLLLLIPFSNTTCPLNFPGSIFCHVKLCGRCHRVLPSGFTYVLFQNNFFLSRHTSYWSFSSIFSVAFSSSACSRDSLFSRLLGALLSDG
jgi:hypothetical protein